MNHKVNTNIVIDFQRIAGAKPIIGLNGSVLLLFLAILSFDSYPLGYLYSPHFIGHIGKQSKLHWAGRHPT